MRAEFAGNPPDNMIFISNPPDKICLLLGEGDNSKAGAGDVWGWAPLAPVD